MKKNPLVSVIMNCHNSDAYLREAIESVYAQTYQNWEVIFWDNASSDLSPEIANSFNSKLRYFRCEEKLTLYDARNKAIEKSNGELIAFLDCDDLWIENKLEKQVVKFENDKIGASFHDVIYFNDSQGDLRRLYSTRPYYEGQCFRQLMSDYYISILTVMLRKSCLDQMDYIFDSRFTMIGDADLLRRMSLRWEIAYVDEALGKWREHPESLSHRVPEKFAEETEVLLETYSKRIENFDQIYSTEISILRSQNSYIRAKAMWRMGNGKRARQELKNHLTTNRNKALFLLSYLPEKLVRVTRDFVFKLKLTS